MRGSESLIGLAALSAVWLTWGGAEIAAQPTAEAGSAPAVVERFLRHIQSPEAGYEADRVAFLVQRWAGRREELDPEDFLPEALALLSEKFRAGLEAADEGEYESSVAHMEEAARSEDPFLRVHAQVFALRGLVELDRLEEAARLADDLLADAERVERYSNLMPQVAYLRAYVHLQALEYEEAEAGFEAFLGRFPEAPERFRVTAEQILRELRRRVPESIGDVADLMTAAGRGLAHGQTGPPVQERQHKAIALLERLIEEAEQQEQQSQSSGADGSPQGGQGGPPQGQAEPSAPAQQSQVQPGSSAADAPHDRPAAEPGEVWGRMPPAQRDRVLQPIRQRFPNRYAELIEQYYRYLAK